jgi:hypothetical protein
MVRDDLQACFQAYQFAELILGGWESKAYRERLEAIAGAERLRAEVAARYEAASTSHAYEPRELAALAQARQRLEQTLARARTLAQSPAPR